ncbi:hypothetical protein SAY86_021666 [Trapa natans]|uniref:AIG1-type G domain-containing protein n=1 Tax=Trapa natans TaxID=22666 RepID=A0AAN7MA53_TRANT|nr:hypothetical protein SAY86_021666 [Trapa natans]
MDHLKPRISLPGEGLLSLFSTASPGPLLVRAPLTLEEDDADSDSDSEPDFPIIKLSNGTGTFSSNETAEAASYIAFSADPDEATDQNTLRSHKSWIFRPTVVNRDEEVDDQEDVLLMEINGGPGGLGPAPIARVSMESDDEEMVVPEEIEEDEFLVARVQGFVLRDKEGHTKGNESQLNVKCGGDHEWKLSEILALKLDDDEMSESNACTNDGNQWEQLEVSLKDDLWVKGMIESCDSGNDEISGGGNIIVPPDMQSCGEVLCGFLVGKAAINPILKDAAESAEPVMVMEMEGSEQESGFASEMILQDLGTKEKNPTVEEVEVGIDPFPYVNELEYETKMVDDVKLVDVLKDASENWLPSLTAEIEKIVIYDGSSSNHFGYVGDGKAKGRQSFNSEWEGSLVIPGEEASKLENIELSRLQFLGLLLSKNADLDFSLNVIVIGKPGVGRSSSIDSILDDQRLPAMVPLRPATAATTTRIKEVLGTVCGIRARIRDIPGLRVSTSERLLNQKMLSVVKKYTDEFPSDALLYVDRLDDSTREFNDITVLQTISSSLSSSIWEKVILVLTHAATFASPEEEANVRQRLDVIHHCIHGLSHMPPMSLVGNITIADKQETPRPKGWWRMQLLLLCFLMKIMMTKASPKSEILRAYQNEQDKDVNCVEHGCTEVQGAIMDFLLANPTLYAEYRYCTFNLLELKIQDLAGKLASILNGLTKLLPPSLRRNVDEDKPVDLPVEEIQSPLLLPLKDVGNDCTVGVDLQSRFSLGMGCSKLDVLVGLRDERRWKIKLRISSSHGLAASIISLLPIAGSIFRFLFSSHCSGVSST